MTILLNGTVHRQRWNIKHGWRAAAFAGITSTPRSFLDAVQEISPFLKRLQTQKCWEVW